MYKILIQRLFSTSQKTPGLCLFSTDFPLLTKDVNSYNKALYNHLKRKSDLD